VVPRNIRFSADLSARIKAEAERDRRNFSDEIRELIRLGLEKREEKNRGKP